MRITCASCQHFGNVYHTNGLVHYHTCAKSAERRAEQMPKEADFLTHFRTFFDAQANQSPCRHYKEKPVMDASTFALLKDILQQNNWAEYSFNSMENRLATKLSGELVENQQYAKTTKPGNRIYRLLPAGRLELVRAEQAISSTPKDLPPHDQA